VDARKMGAVLAAMYGPGPQMARVFERVLGDADNQFTVRVFVPRGESRAVIVYYHGGGWVIGSLDEYDTLARILAERTRAAVVLVDYRLAPEHRFPAAVDDAQSALVWAFEHREELSVRDAPVVVAGDSAGGNLATVAARHAHLDGLGEVAAQVLVYPVTDSEFDTSTYGDPDNQLLLNRDSMVWFWDNYAPDPASRTNPDASPLRAVDLTGLPPAIVATAEFDVLRDEGEAYAARLRDAGVPVEHRRFDGQMHGFFAMVNVLPGSAEAIDFVVDRLEPHLNGNIA
jgi:acetyl esterase/lipase